MTIRIVTIFISAALYAAQLLAVSTSCCICYCKDNRPPSFADPGILDPPCGVPCDLSCAPIGLKYFRQVPGDCEAAKPHVFNLRALKEAVAWSIYHQGCRVYTQNTPNPLPPLKDCYIKTQNGDGLFQIQHATDAQLEQFTREATSEIPSKYSIPVNFAWVCDHEKRGQQMHDLKAKEDFEGIRKLYHDSQTDANRNLLAAVPDSYLASLVDTSCKAVPPPRHPTTHPSDTHPGKLDSRVP